MCKKILVVLMVLGMVSAASAALVSENFDTDPGWLELNNRTNPQTDGTTMNFGYSETSNASGVANEAGGQFSRCGTGNISYYGDDLSGNFTLNDYFEMNWSSAEPANFNLGSEAHIGFFDRDNTVKPLPAENGTSFIGFSPGNGWMMLGIYSNGSSAKSIPNKATAGLHTVRMKYDPDEGNGTLTMLWDETDTYTQDIGAAIRADNFCTFDTFGMSAMGDDYHTTAFCYMDNVSYSVVPEPMTIALLGLGGLALIRRKRA